jgi:putative addiction module killer protein
VIEYLYTIDLYKTDNGKCPFNIWLKKFKDLNAKAAIRMRLDRARLGNLGNINPISNGVFEMKIDVSSGVRIYYSIVSKNALLILCAGTKKTQQKDIKLAISYLKIYNEG